MYQSSFNSKSKMCVDTQVSGIIKMALVSTRPQEQDLRLTKSNSKIIVDVRPPFLNKVQLFIFDVA